MNRGRFHSFALRQRRHMAWWFLFAFLIAAGDYYVWLLTPNPEGARLPEIDGPIALRDLDKWRSLPFYHSRHPATCDVVITFSYVSPPERRQFAVVGLAQGHVALTGSLVSHTPVVWSVDDQPGHAEMNPDGAGVSVPLPESSLMVRQMLKGEHLEVRFSDRTTGKPVSKTVDLAGFSDAVDRCRELNGRGGRWISTERLIGQ
jgi:hypothetical protein